jgi:hypothetical protein
LEILGKNARNSMPTNSCCSACLDALVFGGRSDFDEMKGQRLLNQAEVLLEKGDEVAAGVALSDRVAQYSTTQAGLKARKKTAVHHVRA